MDKRGRTGGVSRYSVSFFCLTVAKNFVGEPLFFFTKLPVSKNFMDKSL